MNSINLAGHSTDEQKFWHTYVFWARSSLDPSTSYKRALTISSASNRLQKSRSSHLQAVVFVAFALEYCLKRLYEESGVNYRRKDTLGPLLQNFKHRIETGTRIDGKGPIKLPTEWKSIEVRLHRVIQLRNVIAHPNYQRWQTVWPHDARRSRALARDAFNALVDMIRVTNRAIGYDSRSQREAKRYYSDLKVF
jgi:hypothetical protein